MSGVEKFADWKYDSSSVCVRVLADPLRDGGREQTGGGAREKRRREHEGWVGAER